MSVYGPFETERLALTPLVADDADAMAAVLDDPRLHRFVGGEPRTLAALRAWYARAAPGVAPDGSALWWNWIARLRDGGQPVGTVQATLTGDEARVAWVFGVAFQGRGLAREAARGLVARLTCAPGRVPPLARVRAAIHPAHLASQGVARAAGLVRTAEREDGEELWELPLP